MASRDRIRDLMLIARRGGWLIFGIGWDKWGWRCRTASPAGHDFESAECVPRQEGCESGVGQPARYAEDGLPGEAVIDGRKPPESGPLGLGDTLDERGIQHQLADLVRREPWPELGSEAKSGEHVEHSLAKDVDEEQAGHGQELGAPGRAKLERDPDSECGGSPAVNGHR